jgi:hypothetical protein
VRAVSPQLRICNMDRGGSAAEYVDAALAAGSDFVQFRDVPVVDVVAQMPRLRQARARLNYCCTSSPDTVRAWIQAGIDFPLVDDISAAVEVASELGIEPRPRVP